MFDAPACSNQTKRLHVYWRRVDECAVNVERQQLVHSRSLRRRVPAYLSDAGAGKNDPDTISFVRKIAARLLPRKPPSLEDRGHTAIAPDAY